ncbi:MAG: tandem-95 repeat protein, partial [Deltaproteobacteria bacterium]|nr:tandem-95 repeat protein [Deltaproteobacteria bacterium]
MPKLPWTTVVLATVLCLGGCKIRFEGSSTVASAVPPSPVAISQSLSIDQRMVIEVELQGGVSEGQKPFFRITSPPKNGSLSGTVPHLVYEPEQTFFGTDHFQYVVGDGVTESAPADIDIQVNYVNRAPVANAQSVSVQQRTAKAITLSGSDLDNDSLTYTVVTQPTKGTLSGTAPNLTYSPSGDNFGADSFTFKVNDGKIDSANAATVSLNIAFVNRAPVANAQSVSVQQRTAKAITLSGSDPDNDSLTDSFTFKVSDGKIDSANPATVSLNIAFVNRAPVANAQSVSVQQRTTKIITLSGSDLDNDSLTYTVVTQPTKGTLSGTAPNLTYSPSGDNFGADSFTFKVSDGKIDSANAAQVDISISTVNRPPTALPQSLGVNQRSSIPITLAGIDPDGDALTYSILSQPMKGSLTGVSPNLLYTPLGDSVGPDFFSFKVNDGKVDSSPATISLGIAFVNRAPIANAQSVSVQQRTAKAITLSGSDPDNDALTYTVFTQPTKGTLSGTAPNLTYSPSGDNFGSDTFTFKVNDGKVDSATVATVSLTIAL